MVSSRIHIALHEGPLDYQACLDFLVQNELGGISIFDGRVRNANLGQSVRFLEFESYGPMALKEMQTISQQILEETKVHKIYMVHRIGRVEVKESAVLIGASSIHRAESIQATSRLIDELKQRVPIWKKEYTEDGHVWINANP